MEGRFNVNVDSSKTIAILSGKGGVGRSFLTVNLGLALALRNNKVLIIDNNPAVGDLAYLTGVLGEIVFDVADIIKGRCEAYKAIYNCNLNNDNIVDNRCNANFLGSLDLIPAPRDYDDMLSPDVMKLIIDTMSKRYDYILIDSQSGLGCGFESSIVAADTVLLLTTTDPASIAACRKFNDELIDTNVSEVRLVINRFCEKNFRKSLFYSDIDELIDDCEVQLMSLIKENKLISIAGASSNPFESYKKLVYLAEFSGKKKSAMAEVVNLAARLSGENRALCI